MSDGGRGRTAQVEGGHTVVRTKEVRSGGAKAPVAGFRKCGWGQKKVAHHMK